MAKKNKKRRSKKLLLIVAGALVLFLLIGTTAVMGNLVFTEKSKNTEFTLVKETGTIYYKSQDDTDYKELDKTEITLTSGSFVKTDKDSYAKIFLEDNSLISLDQSTEIQLDLKESSTNINQLVGRTWNRVRTVSKGGEYEVKTPNAIAAVRGTIFGIDAINNDHSIAFVIENSVDVSRYEKKGDEQNILETIGLSPDEMATIIRDDKSFRIEKQEIPDEFKNKIVKELMEGKLSTKEISRVIKIPKTTIFGWKNKIKKERQEINKSFKELKVVEDQERKSTTSKTLKIISKKGYEIFGLDEEVIIKLFKEGLL